MITLTLAEFRDGHKDEEDDFELYVIKRGPEVLYIGISESGVWNRWFGGGHSHLVKNIYGEYFHTSSIGAAILKHAPKSDKWNVILWTLKDCQERFQSDSFSIRYFEKLLISQLHPRLNVMNAPYLKKIFK